MGPSGNGEELFRSKILSNPLPLEASFMKILVLHTHYQQPGGEDECFRAELALLRSHGHDVVTYERRNDEIRQLAPVNLAAASIWNGRSYRDISRCIAAERPEVMHCHNTFPLISPAVYYAAHHSGIPVVQTLHNYRLLCPNALLFREGKPCEECLGKPLAWPGIAHKCYRDSRVLSLGVASMLAVHRGLGTWQRHVDAFFALSQFSRRKFIEGGLPAERIQVKPNFLPIDPGIGAGDGGYAIFVGRLSREKGLRTLLQAWRQIDVPLRIVGDGPLMELKDSVAPGGSIEFLGRQPPDRVLQLIKAARLLVAPSECYENSPLAVLESFACGTPVLCSDLGAFREIVRDDVTGLKFTPGDAGDLADKANALLRDGDRLAALRVAARREYERKYTADANYRILIDAYERVADRQQHAFA
jgi:glycosyltransferase involved in cell wall biosynthesis